MLLLDEIVYEMLNTHGGGEVFFKHLDKAVQQPAIINSLIDMAFYTSYHKNAIVSGNFGRFLCNYSKIYHPSAAYRLIIVNGGLRAGNSPIDNLDYLGLSIRDKEFIFVDDSFYSGATRDQVRAEIERQGGFLVSSYVIYDGSPVKDPTVHSLFRYYK